MTAAAALPRGAPAVQARGLVKEFEKGRRTIWQRLRGQPDKRTTFRAVDGIDLVVEAGRSSACWDPMAPARPTR